MLRVLQSHYKNGENTQTAEKFRPNERSFVFLETTCLLIEQRKTTLDT